MKSDLIDITVQIHHETERAWLVSDGGEKVWIPKSQAEIAPEGKVWVLTMPEWLAVEKGLT